MIVDDLLKWMKNTPLEKVKEYAWKLEGKIEELKIDARNCIGNGELDEARQLIETDIPYYRRVYRITRGYFDILFYTYEYFSEERNPENENNLIPKGVTIESAPDFHRELCDKLDKLNTVDKTKNICWGASRGSGKSAYLSNIEPTHAVTYRTRKYIIIISETISMSQNFVEFISQNLKENPKLKSDFGEILSLNSTKNEQDNKEGFITHTDIRVQASSIGGQLRGSRFRSSRPDLIICDDLESAKNTNTQELREKNLHWFNSVIVPMGDPKRTAIVYMGTLVHGQGLLPNIMNRADYDSKMYSAVISEPINENLWTQLDTMLRDVENPNRLNDARDFYELNREQMDEGVEVLWADRFSYFDLMVKKVEIGSRAFSSEYLNKPSDDESCIFKEDYLLEFDDKDLFDVNGNRLRLDVYGFWDIALGKNSRSDYNAIIIYGREIRTGAIYILEAWAEKCVPSKAMDKALDFIAHYRPKIFGVETIQAQHEIYRQLQAKANSQALYFTRIRPVMPRSRKEERIESLEPLFEQGLIRIKKHQRLLKEQLIQYPNHNHDDLPDCLASAISLVRIKPRGFYTKPEGL